MNTNYEQQGEKFLQDTHTKMEVEFLYNGFHFDEDKEKRDVYKIILTRGNKSFVFKFGQSISNSGEKVDKKYCNGFLVKTKTTRKAPTAYDVLSCLQKYDVGTFDDWCLNYGYYTDSRQALRTYLLVQKEAENVQRLFGDCIEALQEIE